MDAVSAYHRGELAAQARAGETERAAQLGRSIRDSIPEVAAHFLAERQLIILGAADHTGRLWATALAGPPGFLAAPGADTLIIGAHPHPEDPLAHVLSGPAKVGSIAIEPASRRRMRVNGRSRPEDGGLRIAVDQVFANCPKYIQRRRPLEVRKAHSHRHVRHGSALSAAQQSTISTADTFFLATADDHGNADASHRGGNPGFIEVLGETRLRWPDYYGNAAYMTLGNLEVNPAAGLVFPDWETGTLLYLTGTAHTDWSAGAERSVIFDLAEVVELYGALPQRWSDPEFSPANPVV
jgi:uncharacterized protein